MKFLRRYKISLRIWLLMIFSLIGVVAITAASLVSSRQSLMDEKFSQTRHSVEAVYSVIREYHRRATNGDMTDADARAGALGIIEKMRYDEGNYFWINDMQPVMVMHPLKPQLNGKNLAKTRDPEGKQLFVEFVKVVRDRGEGHVPYLWPKPGQENPVQKISFVKGFQPWDWVVGSGIYVDDVDSVFWKNASVLSAIAALVLVMLIILSFLIISSITRPIKLTSDALMEIAKGEGDLGQRLPSEGGDEISTLSSAFNTFVDKLAESMKRIDTASHQLSAASTEVSQVIMDDNERLDQQYNEIHQVATAVAQMSATVQEISSSAESAAVSAADANKEAETGMAVMQQTIEKNNALLNEINQAGEVIHQLEQESVNIGSVLDVIRGIAEQTNLLALNAAIEAARAGEQGRGFAVVADEVRTLASRTQQSTEEIQQMIERLQGGSRKAVEVISRGCNSAQSTVETANATATSLNNIFREVENISQLNAHIASAVEEQTTVAREIDGSVNQISLMADQTNAGSERIVSATRNLNSLGEQLKELLHSFKK